MEGVLDVILDQVQVAPPWVVICALGLLPLIGVPVSPLWVLTGVMFGAPQGMLIVVLGMAINFAAAFLVATRWLRPALTRLFDRKGIVIPMAQKGEFAKLTLAVRIMPGVPQFLQSYILGLANVPFSVYFPLSFPPQIAWAAGFVILGSSLFSLKGGGLALAACLLLSVSILISIVRKRCRVARDLNEKEASS